MTADDRLNQLEPLVAETLAVLDRHTAQLKQLGSRVSVLTDVVMQQSDNISFLLKEQIVIKNDIAGLKPDVAGTKTDVAGIKTDVAEIKTQLNVVNKRLDSIDDKFELVVQLLQKQRP